MSQTSGSNSIEQNNQRMIAAGSEATPFLAHISFSFAFGVIVLVELLLLVSLCAIGYLGLIEYYDKIESSFYQRGKNLTITLATASKMVYKKKKFSSITNTFMKITAQDESLPREKAISDIFLLDKSGVILAHSDVGLISARSKDPVRKISLKYNNEFFHAALLVDEGQVVNQKYPYPTTSLREKASYFIQSILPVNLDYSIDFSSPIRYKKRNVATVHVIMNRMHMYQFLINLANKFMIITGIVLAGGLLLSFMLLMAFIMRARYLQRVWYSILKYKIEKEMINHEIHNLDKKVIERIQNVGSKTAPQSAQVKDAIYLDD